MRPEIADLFHKVVSHGLSVRARLRDLPQPDLSALADHNAALHGLLIMDHPAQRERDYVGEPAPPGASALLAAAKPYPDEQFLGIRYALACWLDEILIEVQPWVHDWWKDRKLETRLYPPLNERERKFWAQAALAKERRPIDSLEGYYLCVMLGFRGIYQGRPRDLQVWREKVQPDLLAALHQPWRGEPRPRVVQPNRAPLSGYKVYNRMRAAVLALAALAVLAGAFFFCDRLLSP